MEVFYISICGFISRYKFLYETRVLDNSYLRFDSTQLTADGPKVPIEGPVLWVNKDASLIVLSAVPFSVFLKNR